MANITYYKLKEGIYPGDVTKNCGLTGIEVDKNFKFLEDHIIDKVGITDDNKIILYFRNGETITSKKSIPTAGEYNLTFEFDEERGVLIINNNGKILEVPGFGKHCDACLCTDSTLQGNGTKKHLLGIAKPYRTGMYRAVYDIIEDGPEALPDEPNYGERHIVKEVINQYGALYSYKDAEALSKVLKCSEWRIPSKRDWDCMLNAIEMDCSSECKNHNELSEGIKGCTAGCSLKLSDAWNNDTDCGNKYDFSVLPSGYKDRHGNFISFKGDVNEECGYFWTTFKNDENENAYVKIFSNLTDGVGQEIIPMVCKCSLRLVKDYDGTNFNPEEEILGSLTHTVLMPSCKDEMKIWTAVNITYSDENIKPDVPKEYEDTPIFRYSIYEWDGDEWITNTIEEGESVYVYTLKETVIFNTDRELVPMELDIDFIDCGDSVK